MTFPALSANTQSGYFLTKSLRFRASASAYMNRTPSSAGSRRIMTYSFWIKKTQDIADNANQTLFAGGPYSGSTQQSGFSWSTYTGSSIVNSIRIQSGTYGVSQDFDFAYPNVYRDYAGWYHIVVAFDTTQSTASNRCKVYVNNVLLTNPIGYAGRSTTISQNYDLALNNNVSQWIGQSASSSYLDGYMTEVNFIDGQQLTPSSFGSTNATTGVWQPIRYTGTYGTNGFYLPFTNTTSTTTLGYDSSGNGNNWTTNNFSLTAGSTYDSMTDVPTLTSATAANFPTLLPINSTATITDGNLKSSAGASYIDALASMACNAGSGKWYFEATLLTLTSYTAWIGITRSTNNGLDHTSVDSYRTVYQANGTVYRDGTGIGDTATGTTFTTNDVIGVALDSVNGSISFYKNNTLVNTTTNAVYSANSFFFYTGQNGSSWAVNFGQRPFAYTPPTGYVALNTYNLPDSTIVAGNKYMDATTYTGDGTTNRAITNTASFQPDLVWVKDRSNAGSHLLVDSVRTPSNVLFSNSTAAATTENPIPAINSNGFSVNEPNTGADSSNINAHTYVGWQWQAGQGTNTSNTSGTITSTTSVSATAGFSIVTYSGSSSNSTIGHGLGVAPKLVIIKSRTSTSDSWQTWHGSLAANQLIYLNLTNAVTTGVGTWQNTLPTSSLIYLEGNNSGVCQSGQNFVAYCWAEIAGFSKFGSYTGNGSTDGTFVYTGFRPKYVLYKRTDRSGDSWNIFDTSRNPYNVVNLALQANAADADYTADTLDILSNGFKLRTTSGSNNGSGGTYIYAAFAENPFKNALAR